MSFSQEWIQDKEETSISFKIKNFGLTVDGGFKTIDIKTNLDTKDISNSYVNAAIIVNSIFTGIEVRDKHLLGKDYFDALNHKEIVLKSSKLTKDMNGNIILFAELSIKGITKKVEIPLEVFEDDSRLTLKALIKAKHRFMSNKYKRILSYDKTQKELKGLIKYKLDKLLKP